MKCAVLLLCLAAVVIGEVTYYPNDCSYQTANGRISFSSFGGFINTSLSNGQRWFVNPCLNTYNLHSSPCPEGSAVCVSDDGSRTVSRGLDTSVLYADSASGSGVELMMSDSGCSEGGDYKSTIEFVCVQNPTPFWNVQSEGCAVTITIMTSQACPVDVETYDGPGYEYQPHPTVVHEEHVIVLPGVLILAVALCSFLMCCCCAARRRRRCQMAKKIQMEQFSNVAFRPIPSNQATRVPEENAPFNPYVAQPQYFYYYPTQQEEVHEQVPLEVVTTASQDEQMAKQLQAQYDREAQM